ncbi:5'-nucleotidase [Tamaricihabitans halophyticus]|uniref:5'-nucleotidase n=1 Tax=Tamaricihabitans halophyticus TaxID=1262583 RepID=A0A4R2R142_9PSEU|nr:5'/3'-nucleotidase SurE [Tamaricihabitans halophyticus]TCP55309.1 5'-nucleotidase [Tamaricihabitans halophyticus]
MGERPLALVTNDDGITSPGLITLAEAARQADFDVVVAAPHAEASGAGASLSVFAERGAEMFYRHEHDELAGVPCFAVHGHPAYITLAALHGAFGPRPDVVLSGINRGGNIGTSVLHSGTVGAALTAAVNELPALAVSLDVLDREGPMYWDSVVPVLHAAFPLLYKVDAGVTLNVNVPNRPAAELGELRKAGLASFGAVHARIASFLASRQDLVTGVAPAPVEEGTDAELLNAGFPTVTAINPVLESTDQPVPERLDHR